MNTNKSKTNKTQAPKQVAVEGESTVKAKHIKLGIDVHLDRHVVVRILDGGTPQPPQGFGPPEFLLWVAKQITLAEKVFTCYETNDVETGSVLSIVLLCLTSRLRRRG